MARTNSSMLTVFASPWNCIYSAKKLAADQKYPATNVMGTGPFQFVEYRKGSDWTAKKFDRYFIKGLPYLDGLKAYPLLGAGRTNALVGGQVEADFHMFSPAESKRIKDERGDKTNLQSVVAIGLHLIAYNTTKKPLDDVRVRQALNLAIDRWTGIENLKQITFEIAPGGLLRPGYELATPTAELEKLPGLSRDINASRAEAKRLLAEAGVQNLKLNLLVRQVEGPNLSIYLIDQWKQIGVNVELVLADDPMFFGQLSGATFDMVIDNMVESADDPVIMLVKYISDSPRNNTRSKDPVIDDLYTKIKQTLDPEQQRGLIKALEKRVLEQAYQVPLYWSQRTVVMASNIHGYHLTPSFYVNHDLLTVWKD
jgi:peptide/nickel transport system substrate-binding protein